ncbi:hypothetical protein ASG03_13815 [Rhizobium sp. Leaf341]|nr:hypothetical protein ASG03_13815 [Rhizobium sp. Leaf341]
MPDQGRRAVDPTPVADAKGLAAPALPANTALMPGRKMSQPCPLVGHRCAGAIAMLTARIRNKRHARSGS